MGEELTDDVKNLLGNPRKAILSMAVPIAISNIIASCNNIIDAVWLAGLGPSALAATGVTFPFFFMMIAIGNGVGIGAAQAIARRIGAKDYGNTHRVASQAVYMLLVASILLSAVLLVFAEPLLELGGAGDYMQECLDYALPQFLTTPMIMLGIVLSGLLRAEGAAKRSMYINLAGALLNIVLDPIFIYVLGWGIGGASWATVLAMSLSTVIAIYWYFVKKDTFVRIPMRNFRFDLSLDRDILRVGIPAATEMALVALVSLLMNAIILKVDPVDGIAVYTTGWRAMNMLTIPAMSLGNAMVPVCAAAYGARRFDKVRDSLMYSIKMGTLLMAAVTLFTFFCAPLISDLFTYGEEMAGLKDTLVSFFRICCLFLPVTAAGFVASGFFQSLGMGTKSLVCAVFKTFIRLPVCVALISFCELTYIFWGVSFAEFIGAVLALVWALLTLRALMGSARMVSGGDAGSS